MTRPCCSGSPGRRTRSGRQTRTMRERWSCSRSAPAAATRSGTCASRRAPGPASTTTGSAAPATSTSTSTRASRHGREADLRQAGAFDWRDAVRLCLRTRSTPRSSSTSSGTTSSGRAGRRHAAVARGALLELTSRSAPSSRRSSATRPPHRARMVKPPAVYTAGLLRGPAADRHDLVGLASLRNWPAALRRRRPAGTTSAGSTRRPSAAAGGGQLRDAACSTDKQAASLPRAGGACRGSDPLRYPHTRPATRAGPRHACERGHGRREREVEAVELPRLTANARSAS